MLVQFERWRGSEMRECLWSIREASEFMHEIPYARNLTPQWMLFEVLCSSFLWNTFQAREMELVSFTVGRIKITEMSYVCLCVRACMCVRAHVGALALRYSSWKYNAGYRLLSLDYASCPITEMTYLLIWQKHIAVGFTVILELLPVTGSRVLNYISLCTGCMDDDVFS
jgi:hypothetical protein